MPFVVIDDAMPEDVRVLDAGHEALGAVVACMAYSNRALTAGLLPHSAMKRIGMRPAVLRACLKHGLLLEVEDGYRLAEFLARRLPTRDQVEAAKADKAARQAKWKARKDASPDASRDTSRDSAQPKPTRPDPKGLGSGSRPNPPRCHHGRRLAADGAGCAQCDQISLQEVS